MLKQFKITIIMRDIKTTVEVNAHILSFSDKIVLVPLMDALTFSIENKVPLTINNVEMPQENAEKMMQILSDVGCRNSLGESYHDINK